MVPVDHRLSRDGSPVLKEGFPWAAPWAQGISLPLAAGLAVRLNGCGAYGTPVPDHGP